MQITDTAPLLTDLDLALVDLGDLRTAFGGQAAPDPDQVVQEPISTVMCPQW